MSNLAQQLNDEMAILVEDARRSLVQVGTGGHRGGAGTIWHPEGLILSNAHVADRGPLQVTLADGRTLPAKLLATDNSLDVAALAVAAKDLPTIEVGESKRLRPGQLVVAVGHPWVQWAQQPPAS